MIPTARAGIVVVLACALSESCKYDSIACHRTADCLKPQVCVNDVCMVPVPPATAVIGEACTASAQCNVPGTPDCLSQIHPLQGVLPASDYLAEVGLNFPYGYCSNQPNCEADIDCGPQGGCLAPFRNVTSETFSQLEMSFNPPLAPGSLNYLAAYGVCLRTCTDSYDCFSDQSCQFVLEDFISEVPGAVNSQPYCAPQNGCLYCDQNAVCLVDSSGNGNCSCRPGYTGSGLVCTPTGLGACAADPCINGGTCVDGDDNSYTCACPPGLTGTNCELSPACTPDPCENGGTCAPQGPTGYTCACPPGYSGALCESAAMCPTLSPPVNGLVIATSQLPGGIATYECSAGYTLSGDAMQTCQPSGMWSSTPPTCTAACSPNPCQNGGVCTPGTGGTYTCTCGTSGYIGATCSTPVNCGALSAPADGTVTTVPSATTTFGATATYACNTGYTLSGTASSSCQSNGTWSGTPATCTPTVSPCDPNPCQNGGTCTEANGKATCACAAGYSGPDCATAANCGAPPVVANGSVSASSTTVGAVATYSCASGYMLAGSARLTCESAGTWSGVAPTCQPTSCGTYTDVVYRTTAEFLIQGTPLGIGNGTYAGLVYNSKTPDWGANGGSGDHSPFDRPPSVGSTTFTAGFIRLRYTNDSSGNPVAGPVRLVELYIPLIFDQGSIGVSCDSDYSLGIIDTSLSACGDGSSACASHTPALNRQCLSNASGTLSGTTITWASCTSPSGNSSWNFSDAAAATGAGCAVGLNAFGNTNSNDFVVPSSGLGDSYHTWNQALQSLTLSGTNPLTATISMPAMQVPNGTGQSNTWMQITGSSVLGTACGSTVGTDLVCNIQ